MSSIPLNSGTITLNHLKTRKELKLISRGGGVVPHEAHNLETPVQFRPPQQENLRKTKAVKSTALVL